MNSELTKTIKDINASKGSENVGKIYTDVLQLYKADQANGGNFSNDLKTLNAELERNGYLPKFEITSITADTAGGDKSNIHLIKADGSQLSYDAKGNLTEIQYPDKSSRAFVYTNGVITQELAKNADGSTKSSIVKNDDGTWADITDPNKKKMIEDANGPLKITFGVTADGGFIQSVTDAKGMTTISKSDSSSQEKKKFDAPTMLSPADAAKLITALTPEQLSAISDSSGFITKKSLEAASTNASTLDTVLKLKSAFSSISKDGQTIDPDFVARNDGVQLSTNQLSKYNLVNYLRNDASFAKSISSDNGIDLTKVEACADAIKNGINPETGLPDSTYWTPERKDVVKQLLDSASSLSKDGKTIPGAVLTDGYDKEVKFRMDLADYLSSNPEIKSRIVDENGVVDKQKLRSEIDYENTMSWKANPLLVRMYNQFGGMSADDTKFQL
ncbi:MAG: hypothetical protein JST89_00160 [Cyanobacteria bacterium SZAS-4]|nr:hypothetical protein [Cyanobacteria bacterium SZAS-4]